MHNLKGQIGDFVTSKYLQEVFGVHRSTIYRWVKSGKLKAFRFAGKRMFKLSQIQEEIERGEESIEE